MAIAASAIRATTSIPMPGPVMVIIQTTSFPSR
jgi:hypothetical protein